MGALNEPEAIGAPAPPGDYYEVQAPDTLDLAARARLAINALTGLVDPDYDYEIYTAVRFGCRPPFAYHGNTAFPTNQAKWLEALACARTMSGSDLRLDVEAKMMRAIVSRLGTDGLFYSERMVNGKERTWHEVVEHVYPKTGLDFANVYGNARVILAMLAWHQRDGNPVWLERVARIVRGLRQIAVCKKEYAYYPDGRVGEAFSYPRGGWPHTDEPQQETEGAEGSVFMYHSGPIRAFSRWYELTGDREALEIAHKLVNFVLKPRFWGGRPEPKGMVPQQRAHWSGHFAGHIELLHGLLEYGIAAADDRIMEFVRAGYEWCRNLGIPRIGWFPQHPGGGFDECNLPRMIGVAIKLTDHGLGDYWEDVDQYVRNHLVEHQLLDPELLKRVSAAAEPRAPKPPQERSENILQLSLGAFGDWATPTQMTGAPWPGVGAYCCCIGNFPLGLYYAWEGAVREEGGTVRVNLLLNRASAAVDVESYLPYEGKAIVHNKTAQRICLRIPAWVELRQVKSQRNGQPASPYRLGPYLVFEDMRPKDAVTVMFPMKDQRVDYTVRLADADKEYACHFRGNDLVDIWPRDRDPLGYPLYLRGHLRGTQAPMKAVTCFVSSARIVW